jgi:hypothetical protein
MMKSKQLDEYSIVRRHDKLDDLLQEIWDTEPDCIYTLKDQRLHTCRYFWSEPDQAGAFEEGIRFAMQALKVKKPIHTVQCTNGKGRNAFDIEMFFIAEHQELKTLLENTLQEAKEDNEEQE